MIVDHDSLDSVIGRYLQMAESGTAPDRAVFLAQHSRHREGLLSFFADYDGMRAAVSGEAPATADVPNTADERYQIQGEIARGGMGAVLRAVDMRFERPVALKVLREDRDDEHVRRRFLFEAHVTGWLQHPGIPPVHDQGRLPDGRMFLAMKLIEGRTLRDLLDERAAPSERLSHFLGVFAQVCQTLAYAHSKGIIHRDLKPLNVMVGAFGEVQVMDWGMARKLPRRAAAAPAKTADEQTTLTASAPLDSSADTVAWVEPDPYQTVPSGFSDAGPPDERLTRGGEVMGTLAYMPPEQACGHVDQLNERSDVFGLGAILCQILTGDPPYRHDETAPMLARAQLARLDDAFARLDRCDADREIVALARRCLAPKREDRPADAGTVSRDVTGHLEAVQQRLEAARIETAAATARAEADRRRRRLAQLLATIVVLAVLGVASAGTLYLQDRAARQAARDAQRRNVEAQIATSLDDAEAKLLALHKSLTDQAGYRRIINEPGAWQRSLAAAESPVKQAQSVAATGGVEIDSALREKIALMVEVIDGSEKQRVFAAETELIRFSVSSGLGGWEGVSIDLSPIAARFDRTLQGFGFAVDRPDLAQRIRESPLRFALVDAIDFWALAEREPDRVRRLVGIARDVDPDSWRDGVRDPDQWGNAPRLAELANDPSMPGQPPGIVQVLAILIRRAGGDPVPMLHRALAASPQDFALHFTLAAVSRDRREAIGAYRAALAIRPDAVPAHNNLGRLLVLDGKPDAAIAEFEAGLRLDDRNPVAHHNLGYTLYALGRYDQAETHLWDALKLKPDYAFARNNLGLVLEKRGRIRDAIAEFREALRLSPNYDNAKNNLARVLSREQQAATGSGPDPANQE